MIQRGKDTLVRTLRWSEKYTKTDMVYLATTGLWVNLNIVLMSVFSLILSVAFTNLLSPETYGMYQYLLSLSIFIAAVSLTGMNLAVSQAAARGYEGVLRLAIRVQLKWAIVPTTLGLAGAIYYALQGNMQLSIGLVAIAFLTPLSNTFNTYSGFLEGKREFKFGFYLSTIVNVASYASILLALLWVRNAALLITINLAVNTVAMGYAYYKTLRTYKPNDAIDPSSIKYGSHLSVMGAFNAAMSQIDAVLVFHFLGAAQLAVYSLATMLPERIGTLFNFIGTASMPKFVHHPLSFIQQHIIGKVLRIALAAGVVALAYAIATPIIFHVLFPQYLSAIFFSAAYAPVIVLLAITSTVNTTLTAKRLTREIYVTSFAQPIFLIGLQIPLLLLYGIWGMIVARLISDAFGICLALGFTFWPLKHTAHE